MKKIDTFQKFTPQHLSNILLRVKDMVTKDAKKDDILKYLNGFLNDDSSEIKELNKYFNYLYRELNNFPTVHTNVGTEKNIKFQGCYVIYKDSSSAQKINSLVFKMRDLIKTYDKLKDNTNLKPLLLLSNRLLIFTKFILDTMPDRQDIYQSVMNMPGQHSHEQSRQLIIKGIMSLDTDINIYDYETQYVSELNKRFNKQVKTILTKE